MADNDIEPHPTHQIAFESAERRRTTSGSLSETLTWITQNAHHHGYWTHGEEFFVLEGDVGELWIPVDIHVPGMMEADNFTETGRMYRPSDAGRVLASQVTSD
jgi:hypothetical protein